MNKGMIEMALRHKILKQPAPDKGIWSIKLGENQGNKAKD